MVSSDVATSMDDIDEDWLAQEIIDEIERPRRGTVEMGTSGYPDPGNPPGFGTKLDDCGDDIVHFCTGCGAKTTIGRTCKRSVCPRCAPRWVVDRADPRLARLQSVCKTMGSLLGCSIKKHHVVLSPPDDWYLYADDPLDRTFSVVKEILKLLQCEGIICYHGWAGIEEDDRGAWKERLFEGRSWDDDVKHELMERPHFHAIVASPFVAGGEVTKRVEKETGWIIERIADDDSGKSIPDLPAAARVLTYALSHTSILVGNGDNDENIAQIRTFGKHWHGSKDTNQVNVYKSTRRRAERAVREAAPKTLGISPSGIRCETPVPEDEQSDHSVDLHDLYNDRDSTSSETGEHSDCSGDCEESHTASETGGEQDDMAVCKAPLKHIKHADEYLDDEEWAEEARFVEQLEREWNDWRDSLTLDRPPPIVQGFAD
jgi:hypothetical protein